MKLSLQWLFDHIAIDLASVNMPELLALIGSKVVEVEQAEPLIISSHTIKLATVKALNQKNIDAQLTDDAMPISLALRTDVRIGQTYFVTLQNGTWRWTSLADVGSSKDGLMNAVHSLKNFDLAAYNNDTILTISNTSITHRPDLWSHRGFAREIAALLNVPLKESQEFLIDMPVAVSEQTTLKDTSNDFTFVVEQPQQCSAFGLMSLKDISNQASDPYIALRLARVDSRALSALVDLTNYVMLDWGQPLHAYDVDTLSSGTLSVGYAPHQSLELLTEQIIEIPEGALVIKNNDMPLGLAGIMGGKASGIQATSRNIVVEAAHFNPQTIRKTSQSLNLRTEASTRFEKDLDSMSVIPALQRFLFLADAQGLTHKTTISAIGYQKPLESRTIELWHQRLEATIGTTFEPSWVVQQLEALGFTTEVHNKKYIITVPSWRYKDTNIAQDIIEDIGRLFGWNNVPLSIPSLPLQAHAISMESKITELKRYWAHANQSHEVINYPVWDDALLVKFGWQPEQTLSLRNPVAQNAGRLITSLVPNILHNILVNTPLETPYLKLFEVNAVWRHDPVTETHETTQLCTISYSSKGSLDFYTEKNTIDKLFEFLGYSVVWAKAACPDQPWYHPYKTAQLLVNNVCVGHAGSSNPFFIQKLLEGDCFIMTLDLEILLWLSQPTKVFKALSKYQGTSLDVSMLAPKALSVEMLENAVSSAHSFISKVMLVDSFSKPEWVNQRSITLRLYAANNAANLTKADIDAIQDKVHHNLKAVGVTIR